MVALGKMSRHLIFDELAPLLLQEEACEYIYNMLEEKAMKVKDKGGKGKPKDSQLGSSDTDKAWKKNIKC